MVKVFLVPFSVCCEWYLKLTFCYFSAALFGFITIVFQGVRPFHFKFLAFYPFKNRSSAIVSLPS